MRRVLIISMGVMGIGLASVMLAIAWKLNNPDGDGLAATGATSATLNLVDINPDDVVSASLDGDRALLVIRRDTGLTLLVINIASGDVIKSLDLE